MPFLRRPCYDNFVGFPTTTTPRRLKKMDRDENVEDREEFGIVFARDSEIDALAGAFSRSVELREPDSARSVRDAAVLPSSVGVLPPSLEAPRLLLGLELTRWRVKRQKELPHPSRAVLESIEGKLDKIEHLVRNNINLLDDRANSLQEKLTQCEINLDKMLDGKHVAENRQADAEKRLKSCQEKLAPEIEKLVAVQEHLKRVKAELRKVERDKGNLETQLKSCETKLDRAQRLNDRTTEEVERLRKQSKKTK